MSTYCPLPCTLTLLVFTILDAIRHPVYPPLIRTPVYPQIPLTIPNPLFGIITPFPVVLWYNCHPCITWRHTLPLTDTPVVIIAQQNIPCRAMRDLLHGCLAWVFL